jgi:hypothetical protein
LGQGVGSPPVRNAERAGMPVSGLVVNAAATIRRAMPHAQLPGDMADAFGRQRALVMSARARAWA